LRFEARISFPARRNLRRLVLSPGSPLDKLKAITFQGLPFRGKPTRVFAWLGVPKVKAGEKVPAMVLIHGGEVRIAYLGGSITAQEGWRPKTLNWFQEQFPSAKVSQINAAIGGTGSDLGVFRLKQDVLDQRPDLLFDRTRQRSSASGARKSMIQSGSTARRGMRVRC